MVHSNNLCDGGKFEKPNVGDKVSESWCISLLFFSIDESEPTILIEDGNQYFLSELIKTENIKLNINNESTRKKILKN